MYARIFRYYGRSVEIIDSWGIVFCVALLVIVVLLNAIEIFTRYFLGYSSPISMELAVSLSTAMYFIGYMVLLRREEDVVMHFFFDRMGRRAQRLLEVCTHVIVTAFLTVLVINSVKLFILTSHMMHPVFPIKQSVTVLPVLIGGLLCLHTSVFKVWANLDKRLAAGSNGNEVGGDRR
ncbi:MAG: TRAP transporter small permease subunit [Deltaproteobacteria bacterium]|nr:TRAP transporter small permease subunit [Deltaproteobacteria bacterium]